MIHLLDWLGAILDLTSTILFALASLWAWPIGIIAILINACLYYKSLLFADFSLQFIYLGLMAYGWHYWLNQQQQVPRPIRHITPSEICYTIPLTALGTAFIYVLLSRFTPSTTPSLDALTTGLSLLAQWLLSRKVIETWFVWFVVDAVYSGLYLIKGIPVHGIECLIYLMIAIIGYYRWASIKSTPRVITT